MHTLLLRQKLKNFLTVSSKFAVMKTTCFSDVLNFNPYIMLDETQASPILTAIEKQANGSVNYRFQYKIPQSACFKARDTVTNRDGSPTFSLSAIIAVFDELSTLAIVNEDAKTRPGVSTSLHASLTSYGLENIPKEGDTLDFDVSVVKIGKTFGFATAKVYSGDEIVAVAKHSKYLESGGAIEKAVLGPLLPIAAVLPFPKQQDESTINEERDFLESMVMDDILKFENGNELKIQNEHKNPMGICHGGLIAMALEKYAISTISPSNKRVQTLSIDYISSLKDTILFESAHDKEFSFKNCKTMNILANRKNGSVGANATVIFVDEGEGTAIHARL